MLEVIKSLISKAEDAYDTNPDPFMAKVVNHLRCAEAMLHKCVTVTRQVTAYDRNTQVVSVTHDEGEAVDDECEECERVAGEPLAGEQASGSHDEHEEDSDDAESPEADEIGEREAE